MNGETFGSFLFLAVNCPLLSASSSSQAMAAASNWRCKYGIRNGGSAFPLKQLRIDVLVVLETPGPSADPRFDSLTCKAMGEK